MQQQNQMMRVNSPEYQIDWGPSPSELNPSPSTIPVDFSPPLIAMLVIIATAFFIVTYFRLISRHLLPPILLLLRRWRHRWLLWRHHHNLRRAYPPSIGDIESPPPPPLDSSNTFQFFGLDDEVIKTIPLSKYTTDSKRKSLHDCAVCLLEFDDDDYVRTLPICSHSFHVDCIDIWLRSHANCPLCRAGIFRAESPFTPLMAARIRPSLDEGVLQSILLQRVSMESEIGPSIENDNTSTASPLRIETEERREFILKRSYSFGFERNLPANRLVLEAATATPWRYRRGNFWNKRPSGPSPFGSLSKARVFSFRYMKSPFFRRRGRLYPLSESNGRFAGSSRRSKSMTSPMFMRSSVITTGFAFSSSRMRCGDLEALLSPERLNRR